MRENYESDGPKFYTVTEAAEILRISVAHAYRLAKKGDLRTVRLGHRVVVPAAAIDDLDGLPAVGA
jgi:excisionase family DNA binding protein